MNTIEYDSTLYSAIPRFSSVFFIFLHISLFSIRENRIETKMNTKKNKKSKKSELFEVEAILNRKFENGKKFFLIKWKNCPETENLWVLEEDMSCSHMISDFEIRERMRLKRKIDEATVPISKRQKNQKVSI